MNNKNQENKKSSFWTTLPGILTAIAGVMTAIAALITGLNQAGFLGNKSSKTATSEDQCSVIFVQGTTLNWKIKDYDKLINVGILEITNINSRTGEWKGNQITETKNNTKIPVKGFYTDSKMIMIHPSGSEIWEGYCSKGKIIIGSIKTNYKSQLTFEIK